MTEPLVVCERVVNKTCTYKKCDCREPFDLTRHTSGDPSYCWVVDCYVSFIPTGEDTE